MTASLEDTTSILIQLSNLNQQMTTVHQDLMQVKRLLEGADDTPGMKVRLDRLEQSQSSRDKWHMLWGGSMVTAIVAWLAEHFSK